MLYASVLEEVGERAPVTPGFPLSPSKCLSLPRVDDDVFRKQDRAALTEYGGVMHGPRPIGYSIAN